VDQGEVETRGIGVLDAAGDGGSKEALRCTNAAFDFGKMRFHVSEENDVAIP
jgi:hypothetical protein